MTTCSLLGHRHVKWVPRPGSAVFWASRLVSTLPHTVDARSGGSRLAPLKDEVVRSCDDHSRSQYRKTVRLYGVLGKPTQHQGRTTLRHAPQRPRSPEPGAIVGSLLVVFSRHLAASYMHREFHPAKWFEKGTAQLPRAWMSRLVGLCAANCRRVWT